MPSALLHPDPAREIARGSERLVFTLEQHPDLLLKILKPKHLRRLQGAQEQSWRGWFRIRQTYGLYRREQKAWTDAMMRASVRRIPPPVAGIADFVLTPNGLAQLVEHIRAKDGHTAPTLHALLEQGPLTREQMEALNAFVAALYDWHIPAYDLGPKNIVWQDSQARFVLVDGFGDRAAVPLVTWFKKLNAWKLDQSFAVTAQKCPLIWQRAQRRFDPLPRSSS
ncbi:YrbL family protein [Primorskyibacter sp. S187A]|uniref:YrbL family protein n=1 Tax=Primorskyibacter sp. S187A TaxID=3415130 RepID=UPI003C7C6492